MQKLLPLLHQSQKKKERKRKEKEKIDMVMHPKRNLPSTLPLFLFFSGSNFHIYFSPFPPRPYT